MLTEVEPATAASVERKLVDVGNDLARSFNGVLNAIPGGPHRPKWLAALLGLNTVLTSRILKATQQRDPIAVAHMIPGPEPLRRLLKAAEKKKVDAALIHDAHQAVDRFENLIDLEAGDRSTLDAMISGWLPDAREKVELLAKQSIYRGMSHLLGTVCDLEQCAMIVYPSESDRERADAVSLSISHGLSRVRPGVVAKYDTVHARSPMLTVSGEPVDGLHGLMLEEFCSKPMPQLKVTHAGDAVQYTLSGADVGVKSAVNFAHATYLPGRKELYRAAGTPSQNAQLAVGIETPCKTFIFDVLLHEDVYPGQDPSLNIYRTAGVVAPRHAASDVDRIDVIESVQPLGKGIAKFRASDSPRYQDIIRYVCAQRHWDGERLRGYRCRIKFPIYSSEIVMSFELPVKP